MTFSIYIKVQYFLLPKARLTLLIRKIGLYPELQQFKVVYGKKSLIREKSKNKINKKYDYCLKS